MSATISRTTDLEVSTSGTGTTDSTTQTVERPDFDVSISGTTPTGVDAGSDFNVDFTVINNGRVSDQYATELEVTSGPNSAAYGVKDTVTPSAVSANGGTSSDTLTWATSCSNNNPGGGNGGSYGYDINTAVTDNAAGDTVDVNAATGKDNPC